MSEGFGVFLNTCHTSFPEGVNGVNWWATIANGMYIPAITQKGDIRSPIHRLIHNPFSSTINMRKDAEKVPNVDVFFLRSILLPRVFCNIPHCVAEFLAERVGKDRKGAPICGGMLVTRLARLFGLLERREEIF